MYEPSTIIFLILFFLSMGLLIVGTIFYGIQNTANNYYTKAEIEKIIAERVLYEQFAYTIIKSHQRHILLDVKLLENCPINYIELPFDLKTTASYNASGLDRAQFTKIYNKKFCYLDYPVLTDDYEEGIFSYENLLKRSKPQGSTECDDEDDMPCGILDTTGHLLCFPKIYGKCPLNKIRFSEKNDTELLDQGYDEQSLNDEYSLYLYYGQSTSNNIIVENFLSPVKPFSNEWDKLVFRLYPKKDSDEIELADLKDVVEDLVDTVVENGFDEVKAAVSLAGSLFNLSVNILEGSDEKIRKCYQKRAKISYQAVDLVKNIYDNNYKKMGRFSVKLSDIKNWNVNEEGTILYDSNINWYVKNYIGFKDINSYNDFLKDFNLDSYVKNPVYEISSKQLPMYLMIFPICVLIYMATLLFFAFNFGFYKFKTFFIILSASVVILFIVSISLMFTKNINKYGKLVFEMDEYMNETIALYNKRRLPFKLMLGVILFGATSVLVIPYLILIFLKGDEISYDLNK